MRLDDGRELRLREFGTQQRAWAKLLPAGEVEARRGGGHARARGAAAAGGPRRRCSTSPATCTRCCATSARSPGIGRSWVDEILWTARLSPFKKGSELDADEVERIGEAIGSTLQGAIDHYEEVIGDKVPDKLPMPLQVHRRAGEPCPRCGTTIEAIHFKDYVMCYCPRGADRGKGAQGPPAV